MHRSPGPFSHPLLSSPLLSSMPFWWEPLMQHHGLPPLLHAIFLKCGDPCMIHDHGSLFQISSLRGADPLMVGCRWNEGAAILMDATVMTSCAVEREVTAFPAGKCTPVEREKKAAIRMDAADEMKGRASERKTRVEKEGRASERKTRVEKKATFRMEDAGKSSCAVKLEVTVLLPKVYSCLRAMGETTEGTLALTYHGREREKEKEEGGGRVESEAAAWRRRKRGEDGGVPPEEMVLVVV